MKHIDWLIQGLLRGNLIISLMKLFGDIVSNDKPSATDSATWFIVCLIFRELYDRCRRNNNES